MSKAIAIVEIGYRKFAVPFELLEQLCNFREVDYRYEAGGYRYWFKKAEALEMNVTIKSAADIADEEPQAVVVAPPPSSSTKTDARVVAAPTDPQPIEVAKVPPMRDFVDAYRDGEPLAEEEVTA